jgi:hypothetical protein
MIVRHKCDNRACINPEHLELGTYKDNVQDQKRNNTYPTGERSSSHKLTWDLVAEIRSKYPVKTVTELAIEYGVSVWAIHLIVQRKTWIMLPNGESAQ